MRPTVRPPPEPRALRDDEVPDHLETRAVAAVAFLDRAQPASARVLEKLRHVAARLEDPEVLGIVDVARDPLVAQALGITSVPVLAVFVGGTLADRVMGDAPESVLEDTLLSRLSPKGQGTKSRG